MTVSALRRFPFVRLGLVALAAWMWVRSYRHADLAGLFLHNGAVQVVGSDRGRVILAASNIEFGAERAYTWDRVTVNSDEFDAVREKLYETPPLPERRAFVYLGQSPASPFGLYEAKYRYAVLPYAYPVALLTALLLVGLTSFWKRRRWGAPGVCGQCGYDLSATPDQCPECGSVPRRKGATTPVPAKGVTA